MKSFLRCFVRDGKGVPGSSESASTHSAVPKSEKLREPTDRWTAHQILYVFLQNGVGAFIVSGGINFAIAYGMSNLRFRTIG